MADAKRSEGLTLLWEGPSSTGLMVGVNFFSLIFGCCLGRFCIGEGSIFFCTFDLLIIGGLIFGLNITFDFGWLIVFLGWELKISSAVSFFLVKETVFGSISKIFSTSLVSLSLPNMFWPLTSSTFFFAV